MMHLFRWKRTIDPYTLLATIEGSPFFNSFFIDGVIDELSSLVLANDCVFRMDDPYARVATVEKGTSFRHCEITPCARLTIIECEAFLEELSVLRKVLRVGIVALQKAVVVTALVTGRRTELRRFQISPNHGFHRRNDSSSSRKRADIVTALVTGRRTELRRFQISPEHGFHRKSDSSSMRETVAAKTPLFAVQ